MFFKLVSRLILVCTVIFLFWVTKQSPTWFVEQTVWSDRMDIPDNYSPPQTLDLDAALFYSATFLVCIIVSLYIDDFIDYLKFKRELCKASE